MSAPLLATPDLPEFDRRFWDGRFRFTRIGRGSIGGKASGLALIKDTLATDIAKSPLPDVEVAVPTMAVIATDFFDEFVARNHLADLPVENISDDRIGHAFQKAELPIELLGDLRALITQVTTPLAIRSSSLLEDALEHPFAGVYATKMIPNNQFDADSRFRRLTEAVKLIYASTYFRRARDYIRSTGRSVREEKMAVIIQEVVGHRYHDRFYPEVSGVARSYNFYPTCGARPDEGVVNIALGLGKTVVEGGITWSFSPASPRSRPPFASTEELLNNSQTEFWAINMGKPPAYDPVSDAEYLIDANISDAESDESLGFVASTYDPQCDRVVPGLARHGPRILDFAPLLVSERLPLNAAIRLILSAAENATHAKVEIEFACTIESSRGKPPAMRLGFLQVRPMALSQQVVDLPLQELRDENVIVASTLVIGNGVSEDLRDIVYVRPEAFSPHHTPVIAEQIAAINRKLQEQNRPYLLIGFGRWGSSHASLGIPVTWSDIAGARAIVEATLPGMNVELSQGSHFFHNLSSFKACYFTVPFDGEFPVDWTWLNSQTVISETEFVRHVRPNEQLTMRVDGRAARGIIKHIETERR